MMRIISDIRPDRGISAGDKFGGSPSWWCVIGISSLDYIGGLEGGADKYVPVILGGGVDGGGPG